MKNVTLPITAILSLILFACESNVAEQNDRMSEKGMEVEAQAQMRDQSSILADEEFHLLTMLPDQYTFEEADAHYRKHWSIQEGVEMNHNNHSIAIFMIDNAYDISSQSMPVIQYYVNEMAALEFLSLGTIPIFKKSVQALEPTIGSVAANELLQSARIKNEKAAVRFKEVNPEFSAQLTAAQVQLGL